MAVLLQLSGDSLSPVFTSLQQYCLIKVLSSYMKDLEKGGDILFVKSQEYTQDILFSTDVSARWYILQMDFMYVYK